MAQTKRGTSREWLDARTNGDEGWLSALVAGFDLTSPSGLSGLSDAFNLCAENCQRDTCVTVYREWVKKITKFTKSTYRRFVACRHTLPSSQRKSVSAPSCNLCPWSKVNLQQIAESSMLPYYWSITTQREHRHMPTNLWQPGVSVNPAGRLRGSRNKLSEEVICALLRDYSSRRCCEPSGKLRAYLSYAMPPIKPLV